MSTRADEIEVHVHYPGLTEAPVLRADVDWDVDIEATSVDHDAGRYEYLLRPTEPFVYFKAVLRDADGEERWACGPNRLATASSERVIDVFPFFEPSGARVTELQSCTYGGATYSYRVFLPPGYDETTLHYYPTLYMNDGHNLFFRQESSTGKDWGVDDTLAALDEMTSVEQVIVVGVYPNDRMLDYTRQGEAAYCEFLCDGLVPHIQEEYRSLSQPEHCALMGSSLGGVSALSCAWERPDRFGMAGCLSASFGYDDDLAKRVLATRKPELRVYLDSGWPKDNFEVTRDMRARLVRAGFDEGRTLLYFAFPGGRHSEHHWGDRCHVPFQFLFGHRSDDRSRAGQHAFDAAG
ncbi:MAG: alpha/beta hydrolase-fold protein [Planctomycetota bacterium]